VDSATCIQPVLAEIESCSRLAIAREGRSVPRGGHLLPVRLCKTAVNVE
jgi:hypothetical protein